MKQLNLELWLLFTQKISSKEITEKEKLILENLYRCRDLELNNLWQKSIFLAPFLILCFTGYGVLLFSMVNISKADELFKYNLLCLTLCFVSIIFSILWIYMFKGSKTHYEIYERSISKFEEKRLEIGKFVMGKLKKKNIPIDSNLLSTNAGSYSPSRINILIGQVSLMLWSIALVCHLFEIIGCNVLKIIEEKQICNFLLLIILVIIFVYYIFYLIKRNAKSSYL